MLWGIPEEEGIANILAITQRNTKQTEHLISARQNFVLDQESVLQTASKKGWGWGSARGDLVFYYNTDSDYVFFPLAADQWKALSKLTKFKDKVRKGEELSHLGHLK